MLTRSCLHLRPRRRFVRCLEAGECHPTWSAVRAFGALLLVVQIPLRASLPEGPTVHLSPFVVSPSDGDEWAASTSLAGNRTDEEIRNLPYAVDALTANFFQNLGLATPEEAGSFVAGVTVQPRFESRNDEGRMAFRGLAGPITTSRNHFQWYVPADVYNLERIDFSKGSNSLVFGESPPGGQATLTTKRPLAARRYVASGGADSFGGGFWTIDLNHPLTDAVGVRLNAVDRRERTYVDGNYRRFKAVDFSAQLRLGPGSGLWVEWEQGRQKRRRGENTVAYFDKAAPGRAFTQNRRWYYTSDGEVLQRPSATLPVVDTLGAGGTVRSLLEGTSSSLLLLDGTTKVLSGFGRDFNVIGSNDYLDRDYSVFTAVWTQKVGDLDLEVAFNQQRQEQTRNDNSFGTTQTPPIVSYDAAGRPFVDMTGSAPFKVFGNKVTAGRISVSRSFDLGRFGRQRVVMTGTRQRDFGYNRRYFVANAAGSGAIQNHLVTFRAYLDDPAAGTSAYWDQFLLPNLPRSSTFQPELFETYVRTSPYIDVRFNRSAALSSIGEYWQGRLQSLTGLSWHRVDRKVPLAATYALDSRGLVTFPGSQDENPGAYGYDESYALGARRGSLGGVFHVFRDSRGELSVYTGTSESFNWQSAQTFSGKALGPILGNTQELGIRAADRTRVMEATVSVFKIRRKNVAYVWSPDLVSAEALENVMNPNDLAKTDEAYVAVADGLNNERRTVNSFESSSGFEATLQMNRRFGVLARFTAAWTRVRSAPDFGPLSAYLAMAEQRTVDALAPGGNPLMAEDTQTISNLRTIVGSGLLTDQVVGRRSAPWVGSFVLDYEWPFAKGLRVGLSGVFTANYNLGILDGQAFRGGAQLPLGAYAMYARRWAGRQVSVRVGLQNLFDPLNDRSVRKTGVFSRDTTTGAPIYLYRYTDPVSVHFSVDTEL